MVLQKVVEEGHVEVMDTLIDDNNSAIQVGCKEKMATAAFRIWSVCPSASPPALSMGTANPVLCT